MHHAAPRQYTGDLVNVEKGLISRDIFTAEDIYREELERIFPRSWLFVGHESQIPENGDYILGRMAEESVIVNRDRNGKFTSFSTTAVTVECEFVATIREIRENLCARFTLGYFRIRAS